MPALLQTVQRQLHTEDANNSRLVTKLRWIVEARNGHIRRYLNSLSKLSKSNTFQILAISISIYRITGAIINKYHPPILMEGADTEMAQEILERARLPNVVQTLVEIENLSTRNA